MWKGYEGKFFAGRDFYEWGMDYDMEIIKNQFDNEIETLSLYSKTILNSENHISRTIKSLDKNEKILFEEILKIFSAQDIMKLNNIYDREILAEQYPRIKELLGKLDLSDSSFTIVKVIANLQVNFEIIHYKMVVVQLCTILDEYLSKIIKATAMYNSEIVEDEKIKISINEIEKIENKTDMREYFIDNIIRFDKEYSGIAKKIKFLLKKYSLVDQYDDFKIRQLKIERDCIVHRNGIYDKDAAKQLNNKVKENEYIILDKEKVNKYIEESIKLMDFLEKKIVIYYLNYL